MTWKWYIYILLCDDYSYYTGVTWQPDSRWTQHLSGLGAKYTLKHKPIKLVYLEEHTDLETCRLREQQIKRWSRRKKQKLMSGEWGPWQ
jgi:putative endonuclease